MKNPSEAERLSQQSRNEHFLPEKELEFIEVVSGSSVLDAGCGAGDFVQALSRLHKDLVIEGCDIDTDQLAYAKKNSLNGISFYEHDLLNQALAKKYDHVFNRLVAHHFNQNTYRKILSNLKGALKVGGRITVIDADGPLSNIGTCNPDLLGYLKTFQEKFTGDVHIARKIPNMLHVLGFHEITWQIIPMDFKGENRKREVEQWEKRITFGMPVYQEMFGSELEAQRFKKIFLKEISQEHTPMFYNKFIVA